MCRRVEVIHISFNVLLVYGCLVVLLHVRIWHCYIAVFEFEIGERWVRGEKRFGTDMKFNFVSIRF